MFSLVLLQGDPPPCFGVKHVVLVHQLPRSTKKSTKPISFWSIIVIWLIIVIIIRVCGWCSSLLFTL